MAMRGWNFTDCRKFNTVSGALTHVAHKGSIQTTKPKARARSESPQKKGKGADRGAGKQQGTSDHRVSHCIF